MEDRNAVRQRFVVCSATAGLALGVAALLVPSTSFAATTTVNGAGYVTQCKTAGVPVPPSFNYENAYHNQPGNKWIYNGIVDPTFAGEDGQITEVFYYDSRFDDDDPTQPDGLCMALPRSVFPDGQLPEDGPPTEIPLLGVICQGVNGAACFWDNGTNWLDQVGYDGGVDPFWTLQFGDGTALTHFVGGAKLAELEGGNCSGCHQGENVFIVHPGSALDIEGRWPTQWHEPIVPVGWYENPGPIEFVNNGDPLDCPSCHYDAPEDPLARFPQVSTENRQYCDRILEAVVGVTMPSSGATLVELRKACNAPAPPDQSPSQKMMSFEGPAPQLWFTQLGTVSDVTNNVREGDAAMKVNASGYVRLDSLTFNTWELALLGSRLDLDVFVPPQGQPNKYWLGSVQLFMTIPSAQIVNSFVGQVEFTPRGTGWRTVSFQLPVQLRNALQQQHADVRFGIAVNTPQGAPPVILDALRFNGTISMPPTPPPLGTKYDFERGGDWNGYDGAVVATSTSGDQAYLGFGSLKVDLNGASAGRVWTELQNPPAPGTTISYRVFIPTGTPVSAVQPYVADANWVWSHSYNPNLPWGGWMTLSVVVPQGAALPLREIGVKFYLSAPHTGPVYLDAIQW